MSYKIIDRCVCCHTCATNCPVEAITFKGSQYWINPEVCISCGTCEPLCPQSIIVDENAPVTVPAPHELQEKSCGLLVLGAGGAGLTAAIRFAELTGKKVIVLEKGKKCGGSTTFAHNWFTSYSKFHEEAGLKDTTDTLLSRCVKDAEGHLPESLVKKVLFNTRIFFDWLCHWDQKEAKECFGIGRGPMGVIGIDFPMRKFENLNNHDPAVGPGWGGTYLIRKMLQVAPSLGVEVYTEHEAVELLTDESGAVCGCIANNPGGQVKISAKAVVLATGGFSGNDEKLKRFEPTFFDGGLPVHRFSPVTCSGDGMELASPLGAWVNLKKTKLNKFGPTHHPYTASGCNVSGFDCAMVNFQGELKEMKMGPMGDTSFMDAIPEHAVWCITTEENVEKTLRRYVDSPRDGNQGLPYEAYRAEIEFELKGDGAAKRADTLEALAREIGCDPAVFTKSIAEFNEKCKAPKPPMMMGEGGEGAPPPKPDGDGEGGGMPPMPAATPLEKGPFYAFIGQRFAEGAFGGVMTNEDVEVIREDSSVIPGLYAVGDAASTWYTRGSLGPLTELTWAVNSGFFAGDSAAKYVK